VLSEIRNRTLLKWMEDPTMPYLALHIVATLLLLVAFKLASAVK